MLEFLTFAMVTAMFVPFAYEKGKVVVEWVKEKVG
jgi:hypothetical protein